MTATIARPTTIASPSMRSRTWIWRDRIALGEHVELIARTDADLVGVAAHLAEHLLDGDLPGDAAGAGVCVLVVAPDALTRDLTRLVTPRAAADRLHVSPPATLPRVADLARSLDVELIVVGPSTQAASPGLARLAARTGAAVLSLRTAGLVRGEPLRPGQLVVREVHIAHQSTDALACLRAVVALGIEPIVLKLARAVVPMP
jgi:hypothetical protein